MIIWLLVRVDKASSVTRIHNNYVYLDIGAILGPFNDLFRLAEPQYYIDNLCITYTCLYLAM